MTTTVRVSVASREVEETTSDPTGSAALRPVSRGAAQLAGAAFLCLVAGGILWWALVGSTVTIAGDPAATARAVLAHEQRYRLGVAFEVFFAVNVSALAVSLHRLLAPAGLTLAGLGRALGLVDASLSAAMAVAAFVALHLLGGRGTLVAASPDLVGELVGLFLGVRMAAHTVGAVILNVAMLGFFVLFVRARLVPRPVALLGVGAYTLGLAGALANLVVPGAPADLMTSFGPLGVVCIVPTVLAELVAGSRLLWLGFAPGQGPGRGPKGERG